MIDWRRTSMTRNSIGVHTSVCSCSVSIRAQSCFVCHCLSVFVYVFVHVCASAYACVFLFVHVHSCVCVCVCVCLCQPRSYWWRDVPGSLQSAATEASVALTDDVPSLRSSLTPPAPSPHPTGDPRPGTVLTSVHGNPTQLNFNLQETQIRAASRLSITLHG
jgi:hypothetical protein